MQSTRINIVVMSLALLSLIEGLMLLPPAEASRVRVLGIDTGSSWDYNVVPFLSCITFTEVSVTDFATVDLNNFDVLLVSETFLDAPVSIPAQATLDALNARKADLRDWVRAGHGVVALSQPVGTGRFTWLPNAVRPTVGPVIDDDTVVVANPTHPVMAGLTSEGLSGWGVSSFGNFTSTGGLDVLVTNGTTRPITLAGTFGQGRIVITDLDPEFHRAFGFVKEAQVQFVQNALKWVVGVVSGHVVSGHIEGIIPLGQRRVKLINRDTRAELTSKTDRKGEYCVAGVAPGTYDITIENVTVP